MNKNDQKLFEKDEPRSFPIISLLRFRSLLGPLFRQLEYAKVGVGLRTKEKLEKAGITSLSEIYQLSENEIIYLGVRKDIVRKLKQYAMKRAL